MFAQLSEASAATHRDVLSLTSTGLGMTSQTSLCEEGGDCPSRLSRYENPILVSTMSLSADAHIGCVCLKPASMNGHWGNPADPRLEGDGVVLAFLPA